MTTKAIAQLGLQVLFPQSSQFEPSSLEAAFMKADPLFASVQVSSSQIRFAGHDILYTQINAPMNAESLNLTLGDVRCNEALKEIARRHKAQLTLSYSGGETNPLKVYKLLALVSGVFCTIGASVVANCNGHSCVDARQFLRILGGSGWFALIDQEMPVCFLYSAVTCHCFEGNPYYWVRTYGNEFLGVPNLGSLVLNRQWGQMEKKLTDTFDNVTRYMLETGKAVEAGDSMEIDDLFVRFCTEEEVARTWNREVNQEPSPDEFFLQSPSGLLSIEFKPKRSSILHFPGLGGFFK